MKTALVYDVSVRNAAQTADWLEEHGFNVFRKTSDNIMQDIDGALDLLVIRINTDYNCTDSVIGTERDYDHLAEFVSKKLCESYDVIQHCLPALKAGEGKRICFLTELHSSISTCTDRDKFAEHMILAGLNTQAKMFFNILRPDGFTLRCYAQDNTTAGGICAGAYFTMDLCYDENVAYHRSEENRLVMRNHLFQEIPW